MLPHKNIKNTDPLCRIKAIMKVNTHIIAGKPSCRIGRAVIHRDLQIWCYCFISNAMMCLIILVDNFEYQSVCWCWKYCSGKQIQKSEIVVLLHFRVQWKYHHNVYL